MSVRRVIATLAVLPLLALAAPALAHQSVRARPAPAESTQHAVPPAPAGPRQAPAGAGGSPAAPVAAAAAVLLLALIGAGALASRSPRRVSAGAIVAVLLTFIAESGPHLVHHALDPGQGQQCQVLKATTNGEAAPPADASLQVSSTPRPLPPAVQPHPPAVDRLAACGRGPPAA